jgi:tetratricopeptide (TPR) repeat protein
LCQPINFGQLIPSRTFRNNLVHTEITMNNHFTKILYAILLFTFVYFPSSKTHAQTDSLFYPAIVDSFYETQSIINQSRQLLESGKEAAAKILADEAYQRSLRNDDEKGQMDALMLLGKIEFKSGNNSQALFAFWQTIKLKSAIKDKGFSERIYYNMAVTFAAMKKYPLALKYFKKANELKEKKMLRNAAQQKEDPESNAFNIATDDTTKEQLQLNKDTLLWSDDHINLLEDKTIVIDADTLYIVQKAKERKEQKITEANIMNAFDDGKQAIAYGLVIHTKQPVSGKRKTYSGINTVGHMFITLIKYNKDGKYTSRTFGFYPDKDNFLSATPLIPTSTATFKDDGEHEWDEIVAKFIPRRNFHRILRMVKKYSKTKYNLNKNNCTDFGLCIAGIEIKDTHGSWPLGSGNNPGSAGQSILDEKIENRDHEELMIIDGLRDNMQ